MIRVISGCACLSLVLCGVLASSAAYGQDSLRERIKDENGSRTDVWVYNDIAAAREQARKENKPVFVTFRCVPCQACAAFDADVAKGNDTIRKLAKEKFISVRQVEMKGVDLSLFQFDHDLNWAAMFINADGTIYARYGTQSAEGPDAYNSIEGLQATMERVLELHANYPDNKSQLAGKRGNRKIDSALNLPGLENPAKYKEETTRGNCIHCHNIHDAENRVAQRSPDFSFDLLWRYPLPDQLGLHIDRTDGVTVEKIDPESPAAKAGFAAGEKIVSMNGQAITSIADMQWVLHHVPNDSASLKITGSKTGEKTVSVAKGWKEYDASWRGSMWSFSPVLRVYTPPASFDQRKELGLGEEHSALRVQWINRGSEAGKSAFAAGLKEGDFVVALDGEPIKPGTDHRTFNFHIKLNYKVGDELPLTVLRDGKQRVVKVKLVE
ncbi:MAG TPA: Trx7/PDZ domain-containing (seleno)protein [Planctomycetaceae bacterium]|nr:Trx7/PDZ domain-containing (seleno)protein [Planctomycetaceae bacterium]